MKHKDLVIYASVSGNTRRVAERLADLLQADLEELKPKKPYPTEYRALVNAVKADIANGVLPELELMEADVRQYDRVFVGSPNWCHTLAAPIEVFLREHDLAGKTAALFFTHAGGGKDNAERDFAHFCPNANRTSMLVVYQDGGEERDTLLQNWLRTIEQ